ncbi:MAG: hypothetical protein IKO72_08265 [Kiritimatiellae bacterium]|nr:hypothetical protein [Kiritimatiellia bacterium]
MKLQLNREFALRHLGVALLMAALCGWFLVDGAIVYPQKDEAYFEQLHTQKQRAIERQFQFAGLTGLAAVVIALGVLRNKRRTLEWDDGKMCGSLTGGRPLHFSDVEKVDDRRWESKGILVVHAKDGRRVTLDAWHHTGVKELAAKLMSAVSCPAPAAVCVLQAAGDQHRDQRTAAMRQQR